MKNFNLSENFTFYELTGSKDFKHLEVLNRRYFLLSGDLGNLINVSRELAQPIRDFLNVPVAVTSGARFPELNKKVGGAGNSDHLAGRAVDIYVRHLFGMEEIFQKIKSGQIKIKWHQLIYYKSKNFIHISLPSPGGNNGQVIVK